MSVSEQNRMTTSGYCAYPSAGSHQRCAGLGLACTCPCHAGVAMPEPQQPANAAAGDA